MIYKPGDDSQLLAIQVKKYAKAKSVLDIGSGSGIQAKAAITSKAKSVLASDIDPDSLACIKSKNIQAIKSNLFSNIKGKYDLIIFNPPYLPHDPKEPNDSALATSGGPKGDEITLGFLSQTPKHLNKNGIILMVTSSLTQKRRINNLLKKLNYKKAILSKRKFFFEEIQVWKIQENRN